MNIWLTVAGWLLAVSAVMIPIGCVLLRKKQPDFASKNYLVRAAAGSANAVLIHALLLMVCMTVASMMGMFSYTGWDANGLALSLFVMAVVLLLVVGGSMLIQALLKVNTWVLFAAMALLIVLVSAVLIGVFEAQALFSFLWPVVLVAAAVDMLALADLVLDIEKKAQRIVLTVINLLVIGSITVLLVWFGSVGIDSYQAGVLAADGLGSAMVVLVPALIVVIVPPVLSVGSILLRIVSSFEEK